MAITSGFYNAVNHDRRYTAEDIAEMFNGVFLDGVFKDVYIRGLLENNTCFEVTADGDDMTVNVGAGKAWFNNRWVLNDNTYSILIEDSDMIFDRWDAICIKIDNNMPDRKVSLEAITGTADGRDLKPEIISGINEIFRHVIAWIKVKAETQVIINEDITNVVGVETPYATLLSDTTAYSIANNLTTTEPGMVLDAAQGKVLGDRIPFQFKINENGVYGYIKDGEFKGFLGADHIINLGGGTTFNVSSYPQYTEFTESNFIVAINSASMSCGSIYVQKTVGGNHDCGHIFLMDGGASASKSFRKSYDPTNGIFTVDAGNMSMTQTLKYGMVMVDGTDDQYSYGSQGISASISYTVYLIY